MSKTHGQRLYEHKHQPTIRAIPANRRHFATEADVLIVPNPAGHVPWRLLTERCRASWEESARGHWLFQ